jgi:hypothetical protein
VVFLRLRGEESISLSLSLFSSWFFYPAHSPFCDWFRCLSPFRAHFQVDVVGSYRSSDCQEGPVDTEGKKRRLLSGLIIIQIISRRGKRMGVGELKRTRR